MSLWNRRKFLGTTALGTVAWVGVRTSAQEPQPRWPPPVVVFSKIFQELNLDFEAAAKLTAAAGLDGIDCPVRPGGEVSPETVADQLPAYVAVLKRYNLILGLITTAITEPASPYAETILRTARSLGVTHYRLGPWRIPKTGSVDLRELRAKLKDLAAMNCTLGITGVIQNHSGAFVGGNLAQLRALVEGYNPAEIGVAFDLGHAIIVHQGDWIQHFEALQPWVRVAYVKDVRLPSTWVPLGEGEMARTDWFRRLKRLGLSTPISLHVEYDWAAGQPKSADRLRACLSADQLRLREWLRQA